MHRVSVPGSDDTLVSMRIQDIDGNKKLAAKNLNVSTPSEISETKDFSMKAAALPDTSVSGVPIMISISETPSKKSPVIYRPESSNNSNLITKQGTESPNIKTLPRPEASYDPGTNNAFRKIDPPPLHPSRQPQMYWHIEILS